MFHFRVATIKHGLWNQLRVDHGKEFYLTLYAHAKLGERFGPTDIAAFRQTPSTQV